MAISKVDLTRALNNEAYAAQVIRSGKCTGEQRGQLAAQWGSDKIIQWETKDFNQYVISDETRANGTSKADEKVNEATDGFDGKSDTTKSAVAANVGAAAAGATAAAGAIVAFAPKASLSAKANGWIAAAVGAIVLALSLALKALDPNKEQAQACDDLESTLAESRDELEDQQKEVSEATDKIVKETDELDEEIEEENKSQAEAQEDYVDIQDEYKMLSSKKASGAELTDFEEAKLYGFEHNNDLGKKHGALVTRSATSEEKIGESREELEDAQETYDIAAEKMVEVQEITDYQAEFDDATVKNAEIVRTAADIGAVGAAGVVVGGAMHLFKIWTGEAAAGAVAMGLGTAAGGVFVSVRNDQNNYKHSAEAGVEHRTMTEDVNNETNAAFEEDWETYEDNIDSREEITPFEVTATETQITSSSSGSEPSNSGDDADGKKVNSPLNNEVPVNPFAPPTSNNNANVGEKGGSDSDSSDDKVKKDEEL